MTFTPVELSRIRRHPDYPGLIAACRNRFTSPGWAPKLAGRPVNNIIEAAMIWSDNNDFPIPAIVWESAEKVAREWPTYAEKNLTKGIMTDLAEASALCPRIGEYTWQIVTKWIDHRQRGLSPGGALYSRVFCWRAMEQSNSAKHDALYGFTTPSDPRNHPGLVEFFTTDRWLYKSGLCKFSSPSYMLMTTWPYMMALLQWYGDDLRKIDRSPGTEQRRSAFQALPMNLLMADGFTARGGDDFREPAKLPYIAPGFIGNWGAGYRWYRAQMLKANGGPQRFRDLLWGATGEVAATVPRWAKAGLVLWDDEMPTGQPIFQKSKNGQEAMWFNSPFTNIFTDGHSWDHEFPAKETITANGRTVKFG